MCTFVHHVTEKHKTNSFERWFLANIQLRCKTTCDRQGFLFLSGVWYTIPRVTSHIFFHDETWFGEQSGSSGTPPGQKSCSLRPSPCRSVMSCGPCDSKTPNTRQLVVVVSTRHRIRTPPCRHSLTRRWRSDPVLPL